MYGLNNGIPVSLKSIPSFGIAPQNQLTAAIQSLFWDGSQGWWYDDDDTSTLFQDSAGTTPVTAVEQFVGLQLDKSQGLALGPELVTNGTFDTDITGWSANASAIISWLAPGSLSLTRVSSLDDVAYQAITLPAGVYRASGISGTITGASASTRRLNIGNSIGTTEITSFIIGGSGFVGSRVFLVPTTGTYFLSLSISSNSIRSFDNISVRRVLGNHRYAPASGNRPIWSKRVNLLTKTEQFDDAAWTKGRSAIAAANTIVAPDGTLTAEKLVDDTQNGTHRAFQTVLGVAIANYSFSVYVKAAERTNVGVAITSNNETARHRVLFDLLGNGSGQTTIGSGTFAIQNVGDGWYRCSITGAIISGDAGVAGFIYVLDASGNFSYTGTGTNGIYIWGADLRPANQATGLLPLYQRVNTSSDYDTNGFPGYLRADGIDDFLQTNSINFTATDKVTLCAGLRKLSDATVGIFNELSVDRNSNNGSWTVLSPSAGSTDYAFFSKGTIAASVSATFIAPTTNVLTAIGEISTDTALLRVNGTQVASSSADQGTGNYGNYPAYFFRRGGTTAPFNGYEYSNIAVGKLLTASQLASLEQYMNEKTRAY